MATERLTNQPRLGKRLSPPDGLPVALPETQQKLKVKEIDSLQGLRRYSTYPISKVIVSS